MTVCTVNESSIYKALDTAYFDDLLQGWLLLRDQNAKNVPKVFPMKYGPL